MFYFWRMRPNIEEYFETERRALLLPKRGPVNITLSKFKWDALELSAKRTSTTLVALISDLMGSIKPNANLEKSLKNLEDSIDLMLAKRHIRYCQLVFEPRNQNQPSRHQISNIVPVGDAAILGYKHAENARNFIINALPNASHDYLSRLCTNYSKYFQESDERFAAKAKPPEPKPIN